MIFKDYYKILGLETNKVTENEIKIAYREQAKKYHPDVNIGNVKTEERFKDISEAYKILIEPAKKKKYDRQWYGYIGKYKEREKAKENNVAADDVFSILFGKTKLDSKPKEPVQKKVIKKGENVETEIEVSIEEAFYGSEKKISLRTVEGKMKTLAIKVPAGILDSEKIRLIGQGKPGQNGGKSGDLLIRIKLAPDERFRLEGYDVVTDLLLSPWEAALGTKLILEGIDNAVTLHIPAGIQSGDRIKIQGHGYKDGKGDRGNLVAEVKTVVPKKLTDEEKQIYKQLAEVSRYNPRFKNG